MSRFVYPALSLFVNDSLCKDINSLFVHFVWKNKHHHLKKDILSLERAESGLELLNFFHLNTTFKIKWLKKCLEQPMSIWNFIPHNIFKMVGRLKFLLSCNYAVAKLPVKLSDIYQQALLAWKLCHVHNFSPHKEIIWNNGNITIKNKTLYKEGWIDRGIIFVSDLFEGNGNLYSSIKTKSFPVKFKEFASVVKAIPPNVLELMKCHLTYQKTEIQTPSLTIRGIDILVKKCTNKHVRNTLHSNNISPKGKFFWNSQLGNINWRKTCLCPFQFCISNKIRELQFKILHNIYPCNNIISRFTDLDDKRTFYGIESETITHLFYICPVSSKFWSDFEKCIYEKTKHTITVGQKDIITRFVCNDKSLSFVINLMLLIGKFYLHKMRISKSLPSFQTFLVDFNLYTNTLKLTHNKKSIYTLQYLDDLSLIDLKKKSLLCLTSFTFLSLFCFCSY